MPEYIGSPFQSDDSDVYLARVVSCSKPKNSKKNLFSTRESYVPTNGKRKGTNYNKMLKRGIVSSRISLNPDGNESDVSVASI